MGKKKKSRHKKLKAEVKKPVKQVKVNKSPMHKCKNCGTLFSGNFCPMCGQSVKVRRLSWKSVFQDIASGFTNISSGFLHTIIRLFSRPGQTAEEFIRGRRVSYYRPFQLLFILAAIYAVGFQLKYGTLNEGKVASENIQSSPEIRVEAKEDLDSLISRYGLPDKAQVGKPENPFLAKLFKTVSDSFSTNKALTAVLYLPLWAMATMMAFGKRRREKHFNFIEIMFAQCFISCQKMLISIAFLPFTSASSDIYAVFNAAVSVWTLKGLFGYGWLKTIWKYILSCLCLVVVALAVAIVIVCAIVGFAFILK